MPARIVLASVLVASVALPVQAQQPAERVIQVSGSGSVRTPPDVATLGFWVRGEGADSDAAVRALAARQKAIVDGVGGLLGRGAEVTTGPVTIVEVRGPQCEDARGYGSKPRLSEGTCAVTGYLATVQGAARTSAIDKAATAAGLASRLGASDARLEGYALVDTGDAARRAMAAALRDAQARAEAIAAGGTLRLGPIVSVRDGNYGGGEVIVTASRAGAPPPPPPPPEPVALDAKPRPIETRASVVVTYAILPLGVRALAVARHSA